MTPHAQLREWLAKSQTTQRELAAQIGKTRGYVAMVVTGRCRPSIHAAAAIERETGIPCRAWAVPGV